jgi:hypothetical protein
VIPRSAPPVDSRDTNAVLAEFQNRQRGYLPLWNPPANSSGAAMGPIFARLINAILERLNQVPAKDKLAFLDLLGIRLIAAQPARAPIVFSLTAGAADCSAPEGTQVAAPPPPGGSNQIVFSTEQDAAVAAANLAELVSLWPGRDQYINHSAALQAGQPFTLFQNLQLQQTDHILYLAHSKILAFAGGANLKVGFDLAQGSSSALDITWEYWDGQVWRGFIVNQESCLDPAAAGYDGTNGLSASGSVQLSTQGSPAAQTSVNGVNSYWVRGRLTQALLQDPNQLLPEVDTIRLLTQIDQRLELKITASVADAASGSSPITGTVLDECGQILVGATVTITPPNGPPATAQTASNGSYTPTSSLTVASGDSCQIDVSYQGISGTTFAIYDGGFDVITLVVKVEGLLPDKAYSDGKTLDTTKAFYPLGQVPILGTTFYFKQTEVFSKPGAVVSVYVAPALPPSSSSGSTGSGSGGTTPTPVLHTVNWEYWNGNEWSLLAQSTTSTTAPHDFTVNEIVQLIIPQDMVSTTVNNESGLWIRVRLVAGGYGLVQTIQITGATPSSITYVQPQPPIVGVFRFGYSWTQGPYPLEQVFTYNDFQFEDHTNDALWPGNPFTPYQPVGDVTPAVYLGFSAQLPVNNYGVYLGIVEQTGVETGPAMLWEYWNGGGWESVSVEDETEALALPGMMTFLPAADSRALARFDNPLYWLRGRLKEDQPPNETTINNVFTNAVWASQWQTFQNSPLGASTGVPSQLFQFNQIPILRGQEIEVQELNGPRANTEWRTVAIQVVPDDPNIVTELETLLAAEGPQTDIILENVHLVRDKTKSVTAVWIQWQEVENFFECGPNDRVYVLDHAMGRLFFGDGNLGMIPPLSAAIQATSFRSGGGLAGNVVAATITQLLGSLSGVSGVTNPRAAEGGADGETLEEYQTRAPLSIRNRGRAIVAQDYETMAREASAGVAVARAIGPRDPSGRPVPGWVTLMIIPQSSDPQPMPSAGLRQDVLDYLVSRAPADVVAAQRINVIGPTYLPVDVTATLAPGDPAEAGTVEQDAIDALEAFLNPLTGGPEGLGWDVGRGLFASDIATVLGDVEGVDYVQALALYVNGVLQGDQVQVPAGQIVVAGELELSLILPPTF